MKFIKDKSSPKRKGGVATLGHEPSGRSGDALLEQLEADTEWGFETKHQSAAAQAGHILRESRLAARLTQLEVANALSITQSKVSDLERGKGSLGPTYSLFNRFLSACGYEIKVSKKQKAKSG